MLKIPSSFEFILVEPSFVTIRAAQDLFPPASAEIKAILVGTKNPGVNSRVKIILSSSNLSTENIGNSCVNFEGVV